MAVSGTNNTRDKYIEQVRRELQRGDQMKLGDASGELKHHILAVAEVFVEETDLTWDEAAWVLHRSGSDAAERYDGLSFYEMKVLQNWQDEVGQITIEDLQQWTRELEEQLDEE